MPTWSFTLYVTGTSQPSERALANLRDLCEDRLEPSDYDVEVVDVLEHPERAESDGILLTPTLIKTEPPPSRRLIGDLSDRSLVVAGLGLDRVREGVRGGRESC